MRFTQFLLEDRSDYIIQSQGSKLTQSYTTKDNNKLPNSDPSTIIKPFVLNIPPKYLQWTVTQYINDPHFKLEDIPSFSNTLKQYEQAIKVATNDIPRDINKFTNINELRTSISKLNPDQQHTNNLTAIIYKAMSEQVKIGNAEWYEQHPEIKVYQPVNWEGSKAIRRAVGDNNISLCVTYLDDSSFYDNYESQGTMYFILTNNMMYLFFFSNYEEPERDNNYFDDEDIPFSNRRRHNDPYDDGPESNMLPSEFADINNNHQNAAAFIKQNLPVIKDIFRGEIAFSPKSDIQRYFTK